MKTEKTRASIKRAGRRYLRQGLGFVGTIFLVAMLVAIIGRFNFIIIPLIVSAAYALIFEIAVAESWAKVAEKDSESLPLYFMAISGIRMLSALVVMFGYYYAAESNGMLAFFLVFAAFYAVVLVHYVVFFGRHMLASTDEQII